MATIILTAVLFLVTNCKTISAIAFDCSYRMAGFTFAGSVYTCLARVLIDGNENVTTVFGVHETGKGLADVQGLHIVSESLAFFPRNIQAFFPNLVAFNLGDNAITDLTNGHLIPFPSLQYLNLWQNRITSLDSNIFSSLSSLQFINFWSNNIKHIGHDINLPSSGTIDFDNNSCISKIATTPEEISILKLDLLRNCPPTISQIEETLVSRPTLKSLINVTDKMYDDVTSLSNVVSNLNNRNVQLELRVAFLEAIIENKLGIKLEEP